jgi:hypothetical protein
LRCRHCQRQTKCAVCAITHTTKKCQISILFIDKIILFALFSEQLCHNSQ